jgi:hypothetical protein
LGSHHITRWIRSIEWYDKYFESKEWTDMREARRVLNDAKSMIAANPSISQVEKAVRTLWALMPEKKREAGQRVSDETLRQ